ncbi:MAG: DUF883 family protein [Yoonia sp.]|nr:DUF883 family protein [Yoonia sp.]
MPASTSGKSEPSHSNDEISAELAQIKNDIANLGKTLAAFGKDRLDALPDMASKSTQHSLENARETLDEIRREMAAVERDVERRVSEHPAQSLMIAVGLGCLVAFLVRR